MTILSYNQAAHLLRRMGFGGPPSEIEGLVALGREGAVDYLLNYDRIDNGPMEEVMSQCFDFGDGFDREKFSAGGGELRRWWFTRMVYTRRQFEEKMTLFWHNYFATGTSKVPAQHMCLQNLTLRAHATAQFETLLLKVAQDPAMIVWLDNQANVVGSPNENFARELQELFTTGIRDVVTGEANYTEADVKEVARAFTGWRCRRTDRFNKFAMEFYIDPARHDEGDKTIFGQTANFNGQDVVQLLAARRSTARFLTKKLFEFFVHPLTDSPADRALIDSFADVYVASGHSVKELVRSIFTSDHFFSSRAMFALIKMPVEFIVGSIRMLGATYLPGPPALKAPQPLSVPSVFMGQEILNPPDVAGWDLNMGWINTASMMERFNFANALLANRDTTSVGVFVTNDQLRSYASPDITETVQNFLSRLGPIKVNKETVRQLRYYLSMDNKGAITSGSGFTLNDRTVDKKLRGLARLIMCMPEFQLN